MAICEDRLGTCVRRDWLPTATLNLKASTLRFYSKHLENHILPLLGDRALTGISRKDWRGRYLVVQRAIVRGTLTTPKNHQVRRVDLSPQLRAVLRLWRRRKSAEWLEHGLPRPEWMFPSSRGTALDESNVRKAFNAILDKAELHRRGPHQMRHSFASLLLQAGAPITYVSRQLGHKDSAITLRVYARWMPDDSRRKGVDRLDETQPDATPAQPARKIAVGENAVSLLNGVVSRLGIEPRTRRLRDGEEECPPEST